jgi:hypothetical protein
LGIGHLARYVGLTYGTITDVNGKVLISFNFLPEHTDFDGDDGDGDPEGRDKARDEDEGDDDHDDGRGKDGLDRLRQDGQVLQQ